MADLVEDVSAAGELLVCEAGTGTGKTFAYLVPSLLLERKTILSTATKTLQDQLFHRDLPLVRDALATPVSTALLKGRANYLCLHRLALAAGDPRLSTAGEADLERLRRWSNTTKTGDKAEAGDVSDDAPVWPLVTSTVDNCLGQSCPQFQECFVVKARRAAVAADIVVVNHHLLFADLVLREDGFGEILPTAETIILDEAHRIPEIASQFFSRSVSSRQVADLCRDVGLACQAEAPDTPALRAGAGELELALRGARLALGDRGQRTDWASVREQPGLADSIGQLCVKTGELETYLLAASERGPELARCARRAEDLRMRIELFTSAAAADQIQWFETGSRGFTLYSTPLSIALEFRARLSAYDAAWIFTSATLSVAGSFHHFRTQLGLDDVREGIWESPFDYEHQALLYLPGLKSEPASAVYASQLIEMAVPVLAASGGRAFLLFTSYRLLDACAELLQGRTDYPMLVQGSAPRAELLRRFQAAGNAVLLGTSTFWEGVDVRGESLSCVIIDKLPFAPPDDPVMRARLEALEEQGHNSFIEYQIPDAVISLKQGAGRLIRDIHDHGVLVLCDPRIERRAYGRVFVDALPPMRVTRDVAEVRRFFERH